MKITISPTEQFVDVDGCKTRVWQGFTGKGVPCKVYVRLVQATYADAELDAALSGAVEAPRLAASNTTAPTAPVAAPAEAMKFAATAVHKIGAAIEVKRLLMQPMQPLMRAKLEAQRMSDTEIQEVAHNAFELLVLAMAGMGVPDVTVHNCSAADLGPMGGE